MRFSFALTFGLLAASCAAPSGPVPPAPDAMALGGSAPALASRWSPPGVEDGTRRFTPNEPVGEAEEPIAWALVIMAACLVAGTLATEYGCKRHVLEELCPSGSVMTKTVHDTMDPKKSVTVRIPCDVLETMVCGTAGLTGGEVLRHMCAGIL